MLETRLTELDLEFIKLWSEYLLEDDANAIMPRLKDLALKGHMNAIQKWYRFNDIGDSEQIDNIAKNLKGLTVDELLVLARYNHTNKEQIEFANMLIEEWKSLINKCENNYVERPGFRCTYKEWGDNTPYINRINEIRDTQIPAKAPMVDYYAKAAKKALAFYNRTENIFVLQSYLEIAQVLENTPYIKKGMIEKTRQKMIKEFVKILKTERKKDKNFSPKTNPQFFYHFAKAIMIVDDENKYRKFAVEALKEIAFGSSIGTSNEFAKQN